MIANLVKWSLVLSLVGGLSSCMMYDQSGRGNMQHPMTYEPMPMKGDKGAKAKAIKSSAVAKEPMQKSTPGPKRAAAPQLPVIQ